MISDDKTTKAIAANPIFQQYVKHVERPGRNCEPWHALGQRLMAAAQSLIAIYDEKEVELLGMEPDWPRDVRVALVRDALEHILQTTPFLWSNKMQDLADAGPLPKHIISPSVLPVPAMFWTLETAQKVTFSDDGRAIEFNWIAAWNDAAADGIMIVHDSTEVDEQQSVKRYALSYTRIPYKHRWPEDFKDAGDGEGVARFLKRCAFLNSPFVNKDKARLARHHRRQLERAGEPREKIEETVNVVKLRREIKERTEKAALQPTSSIEWKHQWWVSGHFRAQWYPHEEAHRVIWIAPYLKGPSDMPILEKVYAVVR